MATGGDGSPAPRARAVPRHHAQVQVIDDQPQVPQQARHRHVQYARPAQVPQVRPCRRLIRLREVGLPGSFRRTRPIVSRWKCMGARASTSGTGGRNLSSASTSGHRAAAVTPVTVSA